MKIERFEDVRCWEEIRKLVNVVYRAIRGKRIVPKGPQVVRADRRDCSVVYEQHSGKV